MFLRMQTSAAGLLSNTMIPTLPDMRVDGKHWNWYPATTGGHKCPATSASIAKPVTSASRQKVQKQPPMGELKPIPIPEGCWDMAIVDFIVKLPESQGHDAIMVVVDSVGKQAHFIETRMRVTALRAARLYLQRVWKYMDSRRQ
jgi:hypothetical protein